MTPPVMMAKLAPMSVSVGAPVPSFATSCQQVCVTRWKPMPMQLKTVASVKVVERAVVDPQSLKTPEPVACNFVSGIRL